MKILLSIIFCFLSFASVAGGDSLKWSRLQYQTAEINKYDYKPLAEKISRSSTIVGLGEGTHGTAEYTHIRAALVKELVSNYNYRHFVLEAGYLNSSDINNYINGGAGSFNLRGKVPWPFAIEEFMELLKWMREFNRNAEAGNTICFLGMDITGTNPSKNKTDWFRYELDTNIASAALEVYSAKTVSPEAKRKEIEKMLRKLEYSSPTHKNIGTINMLESMSCSLIPGGPKRAYREKRLFLNVRRIHSMLGNKKLILWAHNTHISKSSKSRKSLGSYLQDTYGAQYFTVGCDFNKGSFMAVNIDSVKKPVHGYIYTVNPIDGSLAAQLSPLNRGLLGIDLEQNRKIFQKTSTYSLYWCSIRRSHQQEKI